MKSHTKIFLFTIWICSNQRFKKTKINSINPLNLIFSKVNGYFEELNGNKYLMLASTNESKKKIEKYEELWSKIRDLIRLITKNSGDYDYEKYMKVKFDSDDGLPLNKTIEIPTMTIVAKVFFHENDKYYPQIFLNVYINRK